VRRALIAALIVCVAASAARAQDAHDAQQPDTAAPQQGGALVIEPVRSPFVVAPEYKVTAIDGRTGELAGGYAGRLIDEQLLVAGAIYKLTNLSRDFDLAYGGVIVGWSTAPGARLRFGGRSLVGFGESTVPVNVSLYPEAGFDPRQVTDPRQMLRFGATSSPQPSTQPALFPLPQPRSYTVRIRDNFAVIEPQVNVTGRFTDHVGLDFAVGYRVISGGEVVRDRLNGVTGSLALQFGW
jgi:hypothetical protein